MYLKTFVLLLVSHFLGDIVFTSYKLAIYKRNHELNRQILGIGCHSLVHSFFAGLLLFISGGPWLKAALLVFALHFLIDMTRCRVEIALYGAGRLYVKRSELFAWISGNSKNPDKMNLKKLWPWLLIHLLDQSAHLGSLCVITLAV
jgi:hypothetical protein